MRPRPSRLSIFCGASFVTNAGGWMQSGAIPYVVYQMTHSATWVGVATVCAFVPSMLGTIPGGRISDRHDRATVLFGLQLLLGVATTALWIASANGHAHLTVLLAYLVVQGGLLGLAVPGFQTAVGDYVDADALPRAINLNSGQAQVAKAIGPVIAGFVLAHLGATWVYAVNALTFFAAAIALLWLRGSANQRDIHTDTSMRAGLRAVLNHPTRRTAVILIGLVMICGTPLYSLLSVVSVERVHVGASTYGVLVGLYGVGAVVGNFTNARINLARSRKVVLAASSFGFALIAAGLSTSVPLTGLAVFVAGWSYLLTSVSLMTSVQVATPEYLRGRVVAIYSFAYVGAAPIGGMFLGWLTSKFGVMTSLSSAGAALVGLGLWLWTHPSLAATLDVDQPFDLDLTEPVSRLLSPEDELSIPRGQRSVLGAGS